MPDIKTIPEDIYNLFNPDNDHKVSEENITLLTNTIADVMRTRLAKQRERTGALRFSALGKPDRQLWMDAHPEPDKEEPMPLKAYLKFLFGDMYEALLLFLVREAGHEVTDEQREVEVDGIKGHIDAIIDGVVVDVKSASPYGYKKFEQNTLLQDDPFGYVAQLSGYAAELTPDKDAAWLAIEKSVADICVTPLATPAIKQHLPGPRIAHLKKVLADETPPELCYQPVPDGASGNMRLPVGCSYCKHKLRCHPNLRAFAYSNGPKYLSTVKKEPNVPEFSIL